MNLRKILAEVSDQEVQEGLKATDVLAGAEWEFELDAAEADDLENYEGRCEDLLNKAAGASIDFEPWRYGKEHSPKSDKWVMERDKSLSKEYGAELVCPPMPLQKFLKICPKIFSAINQLGKTTYDCGLHINLSISNPEEINPLKLLLLIDEDRVYKIFKEESRSTFANTVKDLVALQLKLNMDITPQVLKSNKIRRPLEKTLNKQLRVALSKHYGINTGKLQDGYIEFRYTGGADYHKKWNEIKRIIGMYVFVLKASADKNYKDKEYRRKLSAVVNKELGEQTKLIKDTRNWLREFKPFLKTFGVKLRKVERGLQLMSMYLKSHSPLLGYYLQHTETPVRYDYEQHKIFANVAADPKAIRKFLEEKSYEEYPVRKQKADHLRTQLYAQLREFKIPLPFDHKILYNEKENKYYLGLSFLQNSVKREALQQLKPVSIDLAYDYLAGKNVFVAQFPL